MRNKPDIQNELRMHREYSSRGITNNKANSFNTHRKLENIFCFSRFSANEFKENQVNKESVQNGI